MPAISLQDLLDEIETTISAEYPDDPESVDEGVAIAEDFLFGTPEVAGIATSGVITSDDYVRFAESICTDPGTAEFYFGSTVEGDLFFDVRDILDEILQDEFQGSNSSTYTRWGQCPSFGSSQNYAGLPYLYGSGAGDVFGGLFWTDDVSETQTQTIQKDNSSSALSQTGFSTGSSDATISRTAIVRVTPSATISGRAYCDALAKDIQPGGANLVVIGAGFSCEFNYNPNKREPVVEIGYNGEVVSPTVYRYYPKTPDAHKPTSASSTSTAEASATPSTMPAAASATPTAKPKSLDDLFRMYQDGASEQDIERIMQYKGDVPWGVEDPDGINQQ